MAEAMAVQAAGGAPALDLARLAPWLREHVPGADGVIAAEKFAGGQSNPTYLLSVDGAPRFVLRRKPDGVLLASAHAVEREYRVTAALVGSQVPVARPIALCEDAGIVGTAIMFALIFDAFADPLIGELSDRTQSKWGRRLPWLYAAAIPLGISWMLLWHPPEMSDQMTIVWLIGKQSHTRMSRKSTS